MAVVLLGLLIMAERRHDHPLLPLGLFRQPVFAGCLAVGFLLNLSLYGLLFVLGLYFQVTRHWSAWVSGVAFVPLPVVLGIANVLARRIGARLGARMALAAGLLVAAGGAALLARVDAATTAYAAMLPGLLLLPAGIGIAVPVMTASLLGSLPESRAGLASGALNAVRQAGGAIGVALFGGIAAPAAFLSGSALLIVAAILALCLIRSAGTARDRAEPRPAAVGHRSEPRCLAACARNGARP
jgi:MFS transporter, DHA2 family, methylenomycin A resistance protein